MSKDSTKTPEPFVFPTADNHPGTPQENPPPTVQEPSETTIDAGIEETFPASDPVSVTVSKVDLPDDASTKGKSTPHDEQPS